MRWLIWGLLALAFLPLAVRLYRANELFAVRLKRGEARLLRGKAPKRLLRDLEDVSRTANWTGTVRVVLRNGRAYPVTDGRGVPAHGPQRLRNTMSLWPVAKIRNA
ncbi:MAG: DUF3634 family protein [Myxococcota bacterium]